MGRARRSLSHKDVPDFRALWTGKHGNGLILRRTLQSSVGFPFVGRCGGLNG